MKIVNGILTILNIIIILIVVMFLFLVSCTPKPLFNKDDYAEPLPPYMEGGINYGHVWVEPFREDTICNHFFVKQSIEQIDSIFYPDIKEAIEYVESTDGWPCICVYCHKISTCY